MIRFHIYSKRSSFGHILTSEIQTQFYGILRKMPILLVLPDPIVFVPTFRNLPAAAVAQSTFKGPVDKIWFNQIELIRF